MRRTVIALVTTAMVLMALPASAQVPAIVPCDAPPAGVTVITPNDYSGTIAQPMLKGNRTQQTFQLDLSPATALNKASVSAEITWGVQANDFDLFILDEFGGELGAAEGLQPLDPAVESVSPGSLLHCTIFTAQVLNFTAVGLPAPVDTMNLTVSVGSVK